MFVLVFIISTIVVYTLISASRKGQRQSSVTTATFMPTQTESQSTFKERFDKLQRERAERTPLRLKKHVVYRVCARCAGYVEPRGGSAGSSGYVNPVGMAGKVAGGVVLTAVPVVGWVLGPMAILGAGKKSGATGATPSNGVCLNCAARYDAENFAILAQRAISS
jgi:hypothetical protein